MAKKLQRTLDSLGTEEAVGGPQAGRLVTLPGCAYDPLALELDTAPSEVARYFDLLRTLTPADRLKAASAASRRIRIFAEAGLRQRFPHASDEEIRFRLTELLYGADVAARLHGRTP